jgi:hypothetical protein
VSLTLPFKVIPFWEIREYFKVLHKLAEVVELLTCMQKVHVSNLIWETNSPGQGFHSFNQSLLADVKVVLEINPCLHLSIFLTMQSLNILPFDII